MLFEVFPADNPPVPVFGIGGKSRPEVIGKITFTVPVNTVRHAARDLQTFHSRQTSLCVCLVKSQAQRKKEHHTEYPFHVHLILSSLITLAATIRMCRVIYVYVQSYAYICDILMPKKCFLKDQELFKKEDDLFKK